jgi:hypothetical protein
MSSIIEQLREALILVEKELRQLEIRHEIISEYKQTSKLREELLKKIRCHK